jgi:hypothetical protein
LRLLNAVKGPSPPYSTVRIDHCLDRKSTTAISSIPAAALRDVWQTLGLGLRVAAE